MKRSREREREERRDFEMTETTWLIWEREQPWFLMGFLFQEGLDGIEMIIPYLTFTRYSVYTGHCMKSFAGIIYFLNSHSIHVAKVPSLSWFYRWKKWDSGRQSDLFKVIQFMSKTGTVFHFLIHIPVTTKLLTSPICSPSPETWLWLPSWLLESSCPAQESGPCIGALFQFPVTDLHALQPSRPYGHSAQATGCPLAVNTAFLRVEGMQAAGPPYCGPLPSQNPQDTAPICWLYVARCPPLGCPPSLQPGRKDTVWVSASLHTSPNQGFW